MIGSDCYHILIDNTNTQDYRYSTIEITEINNRGEMNLEPIKAKIIGDGIIRLYREFDDIILQPNHINKGDDTMVGILAIPTYFTATDLLGFIGESFMSKISHLRILKSNKPNRFLILIKFKDIIEAANFHYSFNGKPFNSMEPETCHVVYIKSVHVCYPKVESSLIPFLLKDPFTSIDLEELNLIELPTCPVCLEKMDANITGLLTIPCQHTFHCQCLSKWKDDTCPVCRYSQNLGTDLLKSTANSSSDSRCNDCNQDLNLWICLICGNVGCSRYAPEQHSLKHFINTGHCFAMEINTSRVWDYAGDNYVHRLITNESDGKLVELPDKKKSDPGLEYSQLLISQLISQREYYENIIKEKSDISDLENKFSDLTTKLIPSLKEKIQSKEEKLNEIVRELNISNSLNEALSEKIDHLNKLHESFKIKITTLTQENKDLQAQANDLMFYLDNQEKFKNESQDVKDGTIIIQQQSKKNNKKKKK
ncbi:unnamed protein product [Candida verbasci]|uniref:Uncharacterized protein n=1 Tax=Candida verbasci TaxID=1227364 RepID=A0A9W4TT48_9ASCO|nr:unnamed protein product [Candida verbasci]